MALKKCKECDNMVSNQAKTCPHCGARVRKSRFGIEILFTLIVIAFVIALTNQEVPRAIFGENNKSDINNNLNLKTTVESNVSEVLNKEYGITCISTNLLEGADGHFAGTAILEDGREIDIEDARIEGEMIRFKHIVKQGYEYKCKHHINGLKLIVSPENEEQLILMGGIYNDGIEPIRGYAVAELIENRNIIQRLRMPIPFPPDGSKIFDWISPGETAEFKYPFSSELLKEDSINIRLEFFNLGDERLASVENDLFDESVLESIPAKVTSQIYEIQKEKVNSEEWNKIQEELSNYALGRFFRSMYGL